MTRPRFSKQPHPTTPCRRDRHARSPRRRGVALLIVMLLLSMTLGLSYAAMRSQHTAMLIHRNFDCRASARQAARTGLSMAIRKMHQLDEWNGVGTTLTGTLSLDESFEVTYTTGDPTLLPGDLDYEELPYRVTLLSTGMAADPGRPETVAEYQVRAVVRLIPRALGEEPTDWKRMQDYTVFQTKSDSFDVDIPCRIEGRVRIQGPLRIALHYPNDDAALRRYLEDLRKMVTEAGMLDCRPFNGPVEYPLGIQDGTHQVRLEIMLGITAINVPVNEVAADWVKPTSLTTYQIYEGGPVYTIRQLDTTLVEDLEPDPETNPLGIYYRNGTITIKNDVKIRGSLFCRDDIRINGIGVNFEPVELPSLHGESDGVRLPVASCRNFLVESTGGGSLRGLLAVFDRFEIKKGPDTMGFAMTGRLITRKLLIKEREPWNTQNWSTLDGDYIEDFNDADTETTPYFPLWLQDERGLSPAGGTAAISEDSPQAADTDCDISGVDINAIDPGLVLIGAEFVVSTAGNDTVYTVTGRTPGIPSPTMNIEFEPNWGFPTPVKNDTITFLPRLTIRPDLITPVRYHWKNRDDPIYVPHPDDDGLRWELLQWTENP
ncbi:MAG: hypothetical protein V3R99_13085 [Thermoguttaceae bacterium]